MNADERRWTQMANWGAARLLFDFYAGWRRKLEYYGFVLYDLESLRAQSCRLRGELQSRLILNQQLQMETAARINEIKRCLCATSLRLAMRNAKPLGAMAIKFPRSVFTLAELEATNPFISREDIRVELARRVAMHQLQFSEPRQQAKCSSFEAGDERLVTLQYLVAPGFRNELCGAQ